MIRAYRIACLVAAIAAAVLSPTAVLGQEHVHPAPQASAPAPPGDDRVDLPQAPRPMLPPFVPPITDEDRRAAFPDVTRHAVHDDIVNFFVLVDQLEWQTSDGTSSVRWDTSGWVGKDVDRFWFRFEGDGEDSRVGSAEAHALYGRSIARWWDVVAGIRQDFRPGSPETWAAVGIQGLAPYWFEVEATAYVGESGRTHLRLEVEYELLVTNRLVLQPLVELDVYGKADPGRGIGAGLSTVETGLRLRYAFRREFAPYVGMVWHRAFGKTADLNKIRGERAGTVRLLGGVRMWF